MPRKSSRNLIVAQDDGMLIVKVKTCLKDCVDRSEVREVAFNPSPPLQKVGGGAMFSSHHQTRPTQPPPPPLAHQGSERNRTIPVDYAALSLLGLVKRPHRFTMPKYLLSW